MPDSTTALRTKRALADALKARMQTTPFTKITVSDVVSDCGINRKTFYYHFSDIYDLLKWLFEEEAFDVVRQFDLLIDYEECLAFVLRYIDDNRAVLRSACDAVSRDVLKRFFYNDFAGIITTLISEGEREQGRTLPPALKTLYCDFLTEALASMLLNIIAGCYDNDRDTLVENFSTILRTTGQALIREKGR